MRALALLLVLAAPGSLRAEPAELARVEVAEDRVRIETTRPVEHSESLFTSPDRLVLQLEGTVLPAAQASWPGRGRWLRGVRAGQYKDDPPQTRVVLDLSGPVPHKVAVEGSALVVTLGDLPLPAPKTQTPTVEPVAAFRMVPAPASGLSAAAAASAPVEVPPVVPEPAGIHPVVVGAAVSVLLLLVSALAALVIRRRRLSQVESALEVSAKLTTDVEEVFRKELMALSHRIGALEERVGELDAGGPKGAADLGLASEELKELRTVLKSLSQSVQFPRLSR